MAANAYNNSTLVAKEAMKHLESSIVIPNLCNRQYDKMFQPGGDIGKGGSSAYVRIPGFYAATTGATADPNGYNDTVKAITVQQFNISTKFTTAELALNLDDPNNNLIPSLMESLANSIDTYLIGKLAGVNQIAGAPGTAITSHAPFLTANAILDEAMAPKGKRFAVLSPRTQGAVLGSQSTMFNPQASLGEQWTKGALGRALGLDWYMSQNLGAHQVGALGGTPLAGTAVEGASTLPTTGWSNSVTGVLKAGDVFTLAGVYSVNPITHASSGILQQFLVTADANSNGSGQATLSIYPPLNSTAGATQTITALPAVGAALTVVGTAAANSLNNYVMHPDALVMVGVPIEPGGPKSSRMFNPRLNLSIRVAEYWDGTYDTHLTRFDVICGAVLARPSFACKVAG